MSLDLGVALNVILDVLLIGGLAYLMAAPRHLKPHLQRFEQEVRIGTERLFQHRQEIIAGAPVASDWLEKQPR